MLKVKVPKPEKTWISITLKSLLESSRATCIFLINKHGNVIAVEGTIEKPGMTELPRLTAENLRASERLTKMLGDNDIALLAPDRESILMHIIASRCILIVIFQGQKRLPSIRMLAKEASDKLEKIITNQSDHEDGGNDNEGGGPSGGNGGSETSLHTQDIIPSTKT